MASFSEWSVLVSVVELVTESLTGFLPTAEIMPYIQIIDNADR